MGGLKPTRDRIPSGPDYGDLLCGWATEFSVTKSVRDAAALLDALAGPDVGAPHLIAPPLRPFSKELTARPPKLRIAWTTKPASGAKVDPECKRAVERTVQTLIELGHTLIEGGPRYDWEPFLYAIHIGWATFTAQFVDALVAAMGRRADRSALEAVTLACYQDGKRRTAIELLNLETAVERQAQGVPWGAGQGATRRMSSLLRRAATPPCAPGDALRRRKRLTHQVKPKRSATLNPVTLFSRFTAVNCRF